MIDFLIENPLFVILLCLSVGYLFGKINLGFFPNNATLGTLYAAIIINIIISSNGGTFQGSDLRVLKTFFFALFTFVLGYEAGPIFKNSIRTSGIKASVKLVLLAVFYCICVFGAGYLISRIFAFSAGRASGFLAGSQTQSTILNGDSDVVAYAVTYILATLGMIVFAQIIAPKLLKTDLISAVKEKISDEGSINIGSSSLILPVQIRAYSVDPTSPYCGKTIDEIEATRDGHVQIESIYRNGVELELKQSQIVLGEDVIVIVGEIDEIDLFDNYGLTETTDEKYLSFEMTKLDIVVSEKHVKNILYKLSDKGILVNNLRRKGREIELIDGMDAEKGDIISVTGRTQAIKKSIEEIGYIKNEGDTSDIPLLLLSIAIAIPIGLLKFPGTSLTLGTSCCALILGMIVGCEYDKKPRFGYISTGAKWLLRSIGLNLFIAATALERPLLPEQIFTVNNLWLIVAGLLSITIPAVLAIFFGRLVLKLKAADILGGLCGCSTSTPALNAISEESGSTIFAVGYAPAYVVSNIGLTVVGSLLLAVL